MPPKGAKVLVDNCVPFAIVARLRAITSFEYTDAVAENIQAVTDNNLLTYADRLGFSVVLTTDQSMRFQQNMRGRKIGLVVLGTNDSDTLVQHAREVARAIQASRDRAKSSSCR
jgi:hypothetical protein